MVRGTAPRARLKPLLRLVHAPVSSNVLASQRLPTVTTPLSPALTISILSPLSPSSPCSYLVILCSYFGERHHDRWWPHVRDRVGADGGLEATSSLPSGHSRNMKTPAMPNECRIVRSGGCRARLCLFLGTGRPIILRGHSYCYSNHGYGTRDRSTFHLHRRGRFSRHESGRSNCLIK